MAAVTRKWVAPAAIATALTSELDALGSYAYSAASAAIDNTANLYQYIWFEVYLDTLSPNAGSYISIFLIPSLDGTNYADGGGAAVPPSHTFVCSLDLSTGSATKRRVTPFAFECPPLKFKLVAQNGTTGALAASGNTLKYRLGYEQAE